MRLSGLEKNSLATDPNIIIERLREQIDRLPQNSSASNINVHLGGSHGVWVCVTLCALCLLSCLFTLYVVSEIKQNDRDQGNQLNAIYMVAPHLKPEKKP